MTDATGIIRVFNPTATTEAIRFDPARVLNGAGFDCFSTKWDSWTNNSVTDLASMLMLSKG